MKRTNLMTVAALVLTVATAPAAAGTHAGADIADDHLLYFVGPEDLSADTARPAGPADFADLHNDHLLYLVPENPAGEAAAASPRGSVDYADPDAWPLTPDNDL